MSDLISREALYDKATTLEAQALDYVGKLIERDGDEPSVEWKIWSAILTERTAFKHDVCDAPSLQRTGEWVPGKEISRTYIGDTLLSIQYENWRCSNCNCTSEDYRTPPWNYCPNCGARMSDD